MSVNQAKQRGGGASGGDAAWKLHQEILMQVVPLYSRLVRLQDSRISSSSNHRSYFATCNRALLVKG